MNVTTVAFVCPWCGLMHLELAHIDAETQMICGGGVGDQIFNQTQKGCKKPIRLVTDKHGNMKFVGRMAETDQQGQNMIQGRDSYPSNHSINIGSVHGPVAFGSNSSATMNVYNETIKAIDEARNVSEPAKKEAKGALAYFKTHAPAYLPFAADMIKKAMGL